MAYQEYRTAGRIPREMAKREAFAEEELRDFEEAVEGTARFASFADDPLKIIDGEPYVIPWIRSMSYSPTITASITDWARKMTTVLGKPDTLSMADYSLMCAVISFDSGYWILNDPGHMVVGLAAGLRIDCLKALRDGREADLTEGERRRVEFIRAVRDGTVTDESWHDMETTIGSFRGVLEFSAFVCFLVFWQRLMWACGPPAMTIEAWNTLIEQYENGARNPVDELAELQSNTHNQRWAAKAPST